MSPTQLAAAAAWHASSNPFVPSTASMAAWPAAFAAGARGGTPDRGLVDAERGWQADALRDVFANPFRSAAAFDPAWRTPEVLGVAQAIYDSGSFDRMPELDRALHAAGCDDANILDHCNAERAHVRGCWVVDLVLGKE